MRGVDFYEKQENLRCVLSFKEDKASSHIKASKPPTNHDVLPTLFTKMRNNNPNEPQPELGNRHPELLTYSIKEIIWIVNDQETCCKGCVVNHDKKKIQKLAFGDIPSNKISVRLY